MEVFFKLSLLVRALSSRNYVVLALRSLGEVVETVTLKPRPKIICLNRLRAYFGETERTCSTLV